MGRQISIPAKTKANSHYFIYFTWSLFLDQCQSVTIIDKKKDEIQAEGAADLDKMHRNKRVAYFLFLNK